MRLSGDRLVVTVDSGKDRYAEVRRQLVAWYCERARAEVEERVASWAPRLGVKPTAVLIRNQKKRWGSCNKKGEIRINWRIVQASPGVVDYLVVHELAHIRHHGHTPRFWAEVGRVIPDHKQRRAALRALGPMVAW